MSQAGMTSFTLVGRPERLGQKEASRRTVKDFRSAIAKQEKEKRQKQIRQLAQQNATPTQSESTQSIEGSTPDQDIPLWDDDYVPQARAPGPGPVPYGFDFDPLNLDFSWRANPVPSPPVQPPTNTSGNATQLSEFINPDAIMADGPSKIV